MLQPKTSKAPKTIPMYSLQYDIKAARGGKFYARSNVALFIRWCEKVPINRFVRFESDDLVEFKNERNVILCLYELAKIAGEFKMAVPELVRVKVEYEARMEESQQREKQEREKVEQQRKELLLAKKSHEVDFKKQLRQTSHDGAQDTSNERSSCHRQQLHTEWQESIQQRWQGRQQGWEQEQRKWLQQQLEWQNEQQKAGEAARLQEWQQLQLEWQGEQQERHDKQQHEWEKQQLEWQITRQEKWQERQEQTWPQVYTEWEEQQRGQSWWLEEEDQRKQDWEQLQQDCMHQQQENWKQNKDAWWARQRQEWHQRQQEYWQRQQEKRRQRQQEWEEQQQEQQLQKLKEWRQQQGEKWQQRLREWGTGATRVDAATGTRPSAAATRMGDTRAGGMAGKAVARMGA